MVTEREKKLAIDAYKIIDNCSDEEVADLSAGRVAERLGVSLPYLSRAFNNYHFFPLQWTLEKRRFLAFNTLLIYKGKTHSVKETLERLNIESPSHFIKRYKSFFTRTPGQRLKEHRARMKELEKKWARK